jgi:predicted nucleic acid-binding OB-fold protein
MDGIRRNRNIKVPKKNVKSQQPNSSGYLPSRPAEGRKEIPKKVEKKVKPQNSGTRNYGSTRPKNRRYDNRKQIKQGNQKVRITKPTPLDDEIWARVIEHDAENGVVVLLGESKMLMGRYKPKHSNKVLTIGDRIYIGADKEKRVDIGEIMGMARLDRLSSAASKDLPLVIQLFIEKNESHFLNSFFNPAGYLSLKQHAYELLQGVGNKKAIQMVEARGSSGFSSLQQLNESCGVDAAELLAKRFHSEMKDRNLQPRLTDHLLPVKV